MYIFVVLSVVTLLCKGAQEFFYLLLCQTTKKITKKKKYPGILLIATKANDIVGIRSVCSQEKPVNFWLLSPYWLALNKSCRCPANGFLEMLGHHGNEKK